VTDRSKAFLSVVDATLDTRGEAYGSMQENFQRMADMANAYLGPKLKHPLSPADCCGIMVAFKLARLANDAAHADSILDIAGYAAIWNEVT